MKIIEKLSERIEDELHDSEKYIECALKWKENDNDVLLAKMYYDLSIDELKHSTMLHDNIVRLINELIQTGTEVPSDMKAVYDYLHEKQIEKSNSIKVMQAMYRGQ